MCLIVFSYKQHPDYKLIFAANRDEFYERPTRAAQFWDDHPSVLAGKDLDAGGTWMGITRQGRFSALTNYRNPASRKEDAPSRGHLVRNFLTQELSPRDYAKQTDSRAHKYNGFNLLIGNMEELLYYSNRESKIRRLSPGLYGLSNHLINTPWPKVQQARQQMQNLISRDNITEESLFEILANERQAADNALPETGLSLELERAVSSIFIRTDNYGTRASTVLLIDNYGNTTFTERLFKPGSEHPAESNRFELSIGA